MGRTVRLLVLIVLIVLAAWYVADTGTRGAEIVGRNSLVIMARRGLWSAPQLAISQASVACNLASNSPTEARWIATNPGGANPWLMVDEVFECRPE